MLSPQGDSYLKKYSKSSYLFWGFLNYYIQFSIQKAVVFWWQRKPNSSFLFEIKKSKWFATFTIIHFFISFHFLTFWVRKKTKTKTKALLKIPLEDYYFSKFPLRKQTESWTKFFSVVAVFETERRAGPAELRKYLVAESGTQLFILLLSSSLSS